MKHCIIASNQNTTFWVANKEYKVLFLSENDQVPQHRDKKGKDILMKHLLRQKETNIFPVWSKKNQINKAHSTKVNNLHIINRTDTNVNNHTNFVV